MSQDTIESLRARVAELESSPTMAAVRKTVESKVAEENTRLYQRIAELEAEVERLSERRCEVCGYAEHHREHSGCLRQQLAAQALTIKTMREALEKFIDSHEECTDFDGFTAQIVSMDDYHEAQEALALPNDATALNELIAERTKTQKEYYESVFQDGANRIAELTAEVERLMAEHQAACELVAKMHAAAVGEITGPKRGVVEDVADAIAKLRDELETERMRLAGCGVAALGYFDGCCDTYKSASLDDVLRLRDRNAELTAENRELRMSRSLRQEQHDGEIAELTAQRDVAIGILEHIRRCIPYGGFAQIGARQVSDLETAIKAVPSKG